MNNWLERGKIQKERKQGERGLGCYVCGEGDHWARECKKINNSGNVQCYQCGDKGNIAQWCRSRKVRVLKCWKCGVEGHRERDCQVGKAEGAKGGWPGGQYGMGKNGGGEQEVSVMFGGEREKEE